MRGGPSGLGAPPAHGQTVAVSASPNPLTSRLFRQGLVRLVLAANAYRPRFRNRALTIPSFFAGWLVSEAAPLVLATWALGSRRAVRASRTDGGRLGPADRVGLGLSAVAAVGLAGLVREGVLAGEQLDGALATVVPAEDLAAAPHALRAGAVLPVLMGNRRRRITRNISYATADGHRLRLDVYTPLHDPLPGERRPAVLQIHGGGWVIGSKDQQGIPLLNHLASCGWVGFNIDYRLSPKVKYPEHLVDCKRALAWIREHAEEYSVDPDFVVVTGGSAGGHLCALVALTQDDPRFQPGFESADTSVQAAVPFYGVYDMLDRGGDHNHVFRDFLERMVMGVPPDEHEELWRNYSPVDHVGPDAPPMFVIHGDRDVLVPVEGARRFVEHLRAVSRSTVVYAELQGAQHAFEVFPSARSVRAVEAVERFLHHVHDEYLDARADRGVPVPVAGA